MSPKVDTTIRFSGLKSGIYEYHFDLTDEFFEAWRNDEIEGAEVQIDARMERMEHMLMFKFTLSGKLTTYCDRCLGALVLPVEGEEHLCVRFSDSEVVDDEEVVVLPETVFEIDIAQWLYEYVAVDPRRGSLPRRRSSWRPGCPCRWRGCIPWESRRR